MLSSFFRKGSPTNRLFSILFAVVLVIGLMPLAAFANDDSEDEGQAIGQTASSDEGGAEAADDQSIQPQDEGISAQAPTTQVADDSGIQPLDEGISTQELTTIDSITNLRVDNTVAPATATVSNGVFVGISFSWSTYISGAEQATYRNGDKITFDTNIGTLFEFDESRTYDVRDPNSGNVVGTLGITADKVTITFNQAAEDLHFTQYGGYLATADSAFKAKPLQTGTEDLTKTLTIGDASADVKWVGLTKTVRPVVRGNGSISPGIIQTIPDGSSMTFTVTPKPGEEVKSVKLIKPDGSEEPIAVNVAGGTVTINGDDLVLGQSQLVAEFTVKSLGGIDNSPIRKENWGAAVGDYARLNIFVAGDETTSLYANQGSSIDSDKQKEALIVEDTLPGHGAFDGLTIKAVLPDWAMKDGTLYPVRDLGGFEWNNSADMTGYMNKLTQYYNINNVPGNNESYADFKARVTAAPMNWGIYVDSENNSTLIINFGSPASPNVGVPKYSDFWAARLAADPTLNEIAGDGNCVKGKVQYFAINYYAKHKLVAENKEYTNTVTANYTDGYNTPYTESASAKYEIDSESSFAVGAVGHLTINKRDAANLDTVVQGAGFKLQIKNDSGKWVDYTGDTVSGTTDADGKLDLSTLIVGQYKLVETSAPTGYQAGTAQYSTLPGSVESINTDGTFKVEAGDLMGGKGLGVLVTNMKAGHTVTYDKNGGVEVSGTVEDPNSPYANDDYWTVLGGKDILKWAGHYFTGWNTEADGTGKRYPVGATYISNDRDGDIYLYAQWKEKNPKAVASPNVTKAFTSDSDGRPDAAKTDFEFDIKQTGGTAVEGLTASATQNDAGTLTSPFGSRIMFPGVGTYTFKISEKDTGVAGYTYDDTTYTWTVVISEPGVADANYTATGYAATSTLVNDKTGKTVKGGAVFTNKYEHVPSDSVASPRVIKTVAGAASPKPFTFTCAPAATNPTDGVTGLGTSAAITGAGTLELAFGNNVVFSKQGTYVYTISETAGTETGFTYDATKYTWTVVVAPNDEGKLIATPKLTKQGETDKVDAASFANTYTPAGDTYVVPTVTKSVSGLFLSAVQFGFEITADDDAPLPTTTNPSVTLDPSDTSATANFGSIAYTAAGTYTYHITETNSGAAGWTYDTSVYDIEVVVTDNGGSLVAVGEVTNAGEPASAIEFANTYMPSSVTLADPPVNKVVSGSKPATADEFTFKMVGASGAPMPADASGDTVIRTLMGEGSVEMGSITYSTPGTYTYKISEVAGTSENYTYDTSIYDMAVVVADNNGQLEATRTFEKNGEVVAAAEFDNKFTSGFDVLTDKVADKTEMTPGQEVTYTITVENTGNSKAVGVWVKDTVPTGTTFVSCDAAGVVSADKTYVNWFVPELEPGAEAACTYTMTVRVNDDVPEGTKISNTAKFEVTADPNLPDYTGEPQGDTPTASTKVTAKKDNKVIPLPSTATKAGTIPATGDDALLPGFIFGGLMVSACVIFATRRRRQN